MTTTDGRILNDPRKQFGVVTATAEPWCEFKPGETISAKAMFSDGSSNTVRFIVGRVVKGRVRLRLLDTRRDDGEDEPEEDAQD